MKGALSRFFKTSAARGARLAPSTGPDEARP